MQHLRILCNSEVPMGWGLTNHLDKSDLQYKRPNGNIYTALCLAQVLLYSLSTTMGNLGSPYIYLTNLWLNAGLKIPDCCHAHAHMHHTLAPARGGGGGGQLRV